MPTNHMTRRHVTRFSGAQNEQRILLGNPFGTHNRQSHTMGAFPDGSDIPAGRFVVHSPNYVLNQSNCAVGSQEDFQVILPDRDGELLTHNDRTTNFADIIDAVKDADGNFVFLGVSANAAGSCKGKCTTPPCCPIGYEDEAQRYNYWARYQGAMNIVTKGVVTVFTETPVNVTDTKLFVRVAKIADTMPCQYIGGVTTVEDDGTQPLTMDFKVITPAAAGDALTIELG